MIVWGIDYGSKMAGTTAIAKLDQQDGSLNLYCSAKKQDADAFIKKLVEKQPPHLIALDAPLSLPKVYSAKPGEAPQAQADYFFREGDRQLSAMSPMFLGGLTARAMQLKAELYPIPFIETYPAQQAKRLALNRIEYKKSNEFIPKITEVLSLANPYWKLKQMPKTWHEVDAMLALISGLRYLQKKHLVYGAPAEGCIII